MNTRGTSLLRNPHPCRHIVYSFADENLMEQDFAVFASAGLRDHEGVVLIMSKDRYESFKVRLQLEGINSDVYERTGQLICATSEDTLEQVMREGEVDDDLFKSAVSGAIQKVRASVTNGHPARVRVCGEMVSRLRHTNLKATTRFEELCNEVIAEHSVSILCAYGLSGADDHMPEALTNLHSHSIERDASQT